jgi:hypothetical protein
MTTSTTQHIRRSLTAAVCALILTLSGCGDDLAQGEDVKTLAEADATRQVQQYADQIVTLIGNTNLTNPAVSAAPCEGKAGKLSEDIYTVQGVYQLPLPAEQHLTTLARVRDAWRDQGYTITEDRTFPSNDGGTLTADNPTDGYRLDLTSTSPATMVRLLIHSACYRSPTPRT